MAPGGLRRLSLPPDVEIGAWWDAHLFARPAAAQDGIKPPMARGFHEPGMSKTNWDTTWAKSRARRALDAILNSRTLKMGRVRSQRSRAIRAHVFRKSVIKFLHFLHEGGL